MKQNVGFEEIGTFLLPQIQDIENLKLPSIDMVEDWNDYKNRKVYIDFEIGDYLVIISKRINLVKCKILF